MSDLAKKQKEAMERMKRQTGGTNMSESKDSESILHDRNGRVINFTASHSEENINEIKVLIGRLVVPPFGMFYSSTSPAVPKNSHQSRLAELRRKSELSRQRAYRKPAEVSPNKGVGKNSVSTSSLSTTKKKSRNPSQNRRNQNKRKPKKQVTSEHKKSRHGNKKRNTQPKRSARDGRVVKRAAKFTDPIGQRGSYSTNEQSRAQRIADTKMHQTSKAYQDMRKIHSELSKLERKTGKERDNNKIDRLKKEFDNSSRKL